MKRHLPMIPARVLDALRNPIETLWSDNSMPIVHYWRYDEPSWMRKANIAIRRMKLERCK